MKLTHRIEWNGNKNILILDKGPHGHIEMTLDEFVELAIHLKEGPMIEYKPIKPLDADDPWLLDDN